MTVLSPIAAKALRNAPAVKAAGAGGVAYQLPNCSGGKLHVWLAHPVECATQSSVQLEHQSHEPVHSLELPSGKVMLYEIGPWETLAVRWRFERLLFRLEGDGLETAALTTSPPVQRSELRGEERELYLASSNAFELGPAARALAGQIAGEAGGDHEKAFRLYEWIASNIAYAWPIRRRGAEATWQARRGDCGEMACFFCAMARSVGLPARPIFGGWHAPGVNRAHAWAEVWLQDAGWIPVDVSLAQAAKQARIRGNVPPWQRFFGNAAGLYIAFSVGVDIPVPHCVPAPRNPSLASRLAGRRVAGKRQFYWGYELPGDAIPFLQPAYPLYPSASGLRLLDGVPHPGYWSVDEAALRRCAPWEILRRSATGLALALILAIALASTVGAAAVAEALGWIAVAIGAVLCTPIVLRRLRRN